MSRPRPSPSTSDPQRRWRLGARDVLSVPQWVNVQVRASDGAVAVQAGAEARAVLLTPEEALRLRQILHWAAARGIQDRGHW